MDDEKRIVNVIKPHIERCRPGDWAHATRVVKWIKELGEEKDNLSLLITAGYIHDIGWRDLLSQEKITLEKLLELELQANKNSEPYIREVLGQLEYNESDIKTIFRLVLAADKHRSESEDESIIVDADQLSKLDINHLKEKYEKNEWMKMYELWRKEFANRIKTEKAKQLYPELLVGLKKSIRDSL